MKAYRILLGIDAIALGIILYFFVWGLSDGTVSSFNILDWMGLIAIAGGIVAGGVLLQRAGRSGQAKALLALMAVPVALGGLFILILIVANPRWQ